MQYPLDLYIVRCVVYVVANVDGDVCMLNLVSYLWTYCKTENCIEVKIFAYCVTDICETVS